MTSEKRATIIKEALQAQFVYPCKSGDTYDCFTVSGKGFEVLAVVNRDDEHCYIHNSLTGNLIKDFFLKEGGAE